MYTNNKIGSIGTASAHSEADKDIEKRKYSLLLSKKLCTKGLCSPSIAQQVSNQATKPGSFCAGAQQLRQARSAVSWAESITRSADQPTANASTLAADLTLQWGLSKEYSPIIEIAEYHKNLSKKSKENRSFNDATLKSCDRPRRLYLHRSEYDYTHVIEIDQSVRSFVAPPIRLMRNQYSSRLIDLQPRVSVILSCNSRGIWGTDDSNRACVDDLKISFFPLFFFPREEHPRDSTGCVQLQGSHIFLASGMIPSRNSKEFIAWMSLWNIREHPNVITWWGQNSCFHHGTRVSICIMTFCARLPKQSISILSCMIFLRTRLHGREKIGDCHVTPKSTCTCWSHHYSSDFVYMYTILNKSEFSWSPLLLCSPSYRWSMWQYMNDTVCAYNSKELELCSPCYPLPVAIYTSATDTCETWLFLALATHHQNYSCMEKHTWFSTLMVFIGWPQLSRMRWYNKIVTHELLHEIIADQDHVDNQICDAYFQFVSQPINSLDASLPMWFMILHTQFFCYI